MSDGSLLYIDIILSILASLLALLGILGIVSCLGLYLTIRLTLIPDVSDWEVGIMNP